MTPEQKPIGYDPSTGRAVLGFDPNSGLPIFAQAQAAAPAMPSTPPFNPPRIAQGRGTQIDLTGKNAAETTKMLRENAPIILGTAAAGFTGGASIPVQAAVIGGASAFGRLIKDSDDEMSGGDRVLNAAKSGTIDAGIQYVGGKAPEVIGNLGKAVYRGYLKPSLTGTEIAKAKDIVDTAIREWLPITQGGVDRAKILVSRINKEVDQHLRNAQYGKPLDLTKVADKVRAFARSMYNRPGAPSEDLASALKVADQIDKHASLGLAPGAAGRIADPKSVTPVQMNETKQALDKAVGDTGFGVERNAATEARKVGRHAARVDIEAAVPVVAGLNKRESQIIDAIEALTKATGREANKNPLTGVSTILSGATGAGVAAQSGAIEGVMSMLVTRGLLEPAVATRAAILAARFERVPGTGVAQAIRMGALLATRELSEKQD